MSEVAAHDLKFPQWFTRLCVLASLVWFLALAYQISLGIWWTASNEVIVQQQQQQIQELHDQIELLKLRANKLEREYAVLLDRTQREKAP